jgi:hypothetical protein
MNKIITAIALVMLPGVFTMNEAEELSQQMLGHPYDHSRHQGRSKLSPEQRVENLNHKP